MTRATQPKNLDAILANNGYESNSRTSVQTAEIGNTDPDSFPNAEANNMLTEEWFAYFCRMNNVWDKTTRRSGQSSKKSYCQNALWQFATTANLSRVE
jgi:hypothetical protein